MNPQRDRVRLNRVVQANSDHRIALADLSFNNVAVTDLHNADHVSYTVTIDSVIVSQGEATYGVYDHGKKPLTGWYVFLKMPNYQTTVFITWSVGVEAGNQTWLEQLDVVV